MRFHPPRNMTDTKRLAFSIIQFLQDQVKSGGCSSDTQESLEGKLFQYGVCFWACLSLRSCIYTYTLHNCVLVAIQCLETAFNVSMDDQSLAVTQTLPEIFASATVKVTAREKVCVRPHFVKYFFFCTSVTTHVSLLTSLLVS